MLCEDVATALPSILDGGRRASSDCIGHVETCLACQAELARYRKLLRLMQDLRSERVNPPPGLLADVIGALESAAERGAVRSALSGRRIAYGAAVAGTITAAGLVLLIARRSLRAQVAAPVVPPEQGAIV